MWRLLLSSCFLLSAAAQDLAISSAALPAFPGLYSVAPKSLIVAIPPDTFPALPANIAAIRLEMLPRGSTQSLSMTVTAAAAGMIWALVPANAPLGRSAVTLTVNSRSVTGQVNVTSSSFGLFSALRDGSGPAIAQNVADGAAPVVNRLTSPVLPGQYVTLWGTGIGDFTTPDVTVEIDGTIVQPTFAGHSPGLPGVDQINLRVPANVSSGCYIPVNATAGGTDITNQVAIATATLPGTACVHPLGLSADELKRLDQGGTVVIGSLETSSMAYPQSDATDFYRDDRIYVSFLVADAQHAFTASLTPLAVPRTCSLIAPRTGDFSAGGSPYSNPTVYGDAGASLTFSGPAQQKLTIPNVYGAYFTYLDAPPTAASIATLAPSFFAGGTWTLSAPGGADIAGFQQALPLPAPFHWTNRDTLPPIDRNADLLVTWDSQGASAADIVTVQIASRPPQGASLPAGVSTGVSCVGPAQPGKLALPHSLLQKIAVTLPGYSSSLSVSSYFSRPPFTVPLKTGGTAATSNTSYFSEMIPVVVQ